MASCRPQRVAIPAHTVTYTERAMLSKADNDSRTKVQAVAYPCRERGGIVWAYLGPNEPPPLPDIEANMLAPDQAKADAVMRECNWLQGLEGDIDTSHLGFLHMGALDAATMD